MMSFMNRANLYFRQNRPINQDCTVCVGYNIHGLVEISFPSTGCPHDKSGSCIACDYGVGTPIKDWTTLEKQLDDVLGEFETGMELLLLCTNGSFFCDANISPEFRRHIMEKSVRTSAKMIIIETHVNDIDESKLSEFAQICCGKKLCLEIGVESTNRFVRENCYNKRLETDRLLECLRMAEKYSIKPSIHFMLGAPFLSIEEQLNDLLRSVEWAFANQAEVVLFPVNIKPYTLLMYLYEHQFYEPVSHWLFIEALNRIEAKYLDETCIAWYGNREMKYEQERGTVFPTSCPQCGPLLQQFYDEYTRIKSSGERRKKIESLITRCAKLCNCYRNMLYTLNQGSHSDMEGRVMESHQKVLLQLQNDGIPI